MSTTRTTAPTSGPTQLPTWSWDVQVTDLESMLATDDAGVDTAIIPTLAFREAVEESATPGTAAVTTSRVDTGVESAVVPAPTPATEVAEPVAPTVVGVHLRSRHATPESRAAVRRNLIAVCCVAVAIVVIGIAAGLVGGWIALTAYALLVITAAFAMRRVNARYAPRHSRHIPRHA